VHETTAGGVIRIQEFAKRLGISVWTARRKAYEGAIDSCKIGALLYVPESEVGRIIAAGMRPRIIPSPGRQAA